MYFTSGSDRAFEQLMQTRPGADHFDNGEAGAPEDCGTCRFYRPHWKYQFCVYEECPYQPGKLTALDGAVKFQVKGVDDEMAVFRVEKNRGYTVMSNHHLRNKDLSLKAKGLLSQMLSLPEDWDFTLKGLSLINREQIDAIRAAVRELEQAGYIVRSRERDSQGRLRGADYIIYEQPQPVPDSPTLENPTLDNPTQENPTQEKPTQLNKDRLSNAVDVLFDGENFYHFETSRIDTKNTHGTGCTFSSAIASQLAKGKSVPLAVESAKAYVTMAIEHSLAIGKGCGPTHHFYELYQHGLSKE